MCEILFSVPTEGMLLLLAKVTNVGLTLRVCVSAKYYFKRSIIRHFCLFKHSSNRVPKCHIMLPSLLNTVNCQGKSMIQSNIYLKCPNKLQLKLRLNRYAWLWFYSGNIVINISKTLDI